MFVERWRMAIQDMARQVAVAAIWKRRAEEGAVVWEDPSIEEIEDEARRLAPRGQGSEIPD